MGALYLCDNCDFYQKGRAPHFKCQRCGVEGMIYREVSIEEMREKNNDPARDE